MRARDATLGAAGGDGNRWLPTVLIFHIPDRVLEEILPHRIFSDWSDFDRVVLASRCPQHVKDIPNLSVPALQALLQRLGHQEPTEDNGAQPTPRQLLAAFKAKAQEQSAELDRLEWGLTWLASKAGKKWHSQGGFKRLCGGSLPDQPAQANQPAEGSVAAGLVALQARDNHGDCEHYGGHCRRKVQLVIRSENLWEELFGPQYVSCFVVDPEPRQ